MWRTLTPELVSCLALWPCLLLFFSCASASWRHLQYRGIRSSLLCIFVSSFLSHSLERCSFCSSQKSILVGLDDGTVFSSFYDLTFDSHKQNLNVAHGVGALGMIEHQTLFTWTLTLIFFLTLTLTLILILTLMIRSQLTFIRPPTVRPPDILRGEKPASTSSSHALPSPPSSPLCSVRFGKSAIHSIERKRTMLVGSVMM